MTICDTEVDPDLSCSGSAAHYTDLFVSSFKRMMILGSCYQRMWSPCEEYVRKGCLGGI